MRRWRFLLLVLLAVILTTPWPAQAGNSVTCANGANVDDLAKCAFFAHFSRGQTTNRQVRENLHAADTESVRSIALVVGVSAYPNFAEARIPAAHDDVINLRRFLIGDQQFDEVIVLENDEATKENISYFLEVYIHKQNERYNHKTRVLFAYSGHGVNGDEHGNDAALVLNQAEDDRSPETQFQLSELRRLLQDLAPKSFQVVALINACYAAEIFDNAPGGGNPDITDEHGAHAVTAGKIGSLVWASGEPGHGSIFFDAVLTAVRSASAADSLVQQRIVGASSGQVLQEGNAVPLGQVMYFATQSMKSRPIPPSANTASPQTPSNDARQWLWWDSIEPDGPSEGAFFFLSPVNQHWNWNLRQVFNDPTALLTRPLQVVTGQAAISAPAGPISALPNRPDIRVFNPPYQYPIQGIDISAAVTGAIDWHKVANSGVQFVYFKATEGASRIDARFSQNLIEVSASGLNYGVYHVFSFCQDVDAQIENVERAFPMGNATLPAVVDFTGYHSSASGETCQISARVARENALTFLHELEAHYGKRPLIYSPRRLFDDFLDARFSPFPLWVADFSEGETQASQSSQKPWTLWRYSTTGAVDGITGAVNRDVFFGDSTQFTQFMNGDPDVAARQLIAAAPTESH